MTPVRIERIIPDAETRERISGIVFADESRGLALTPDTANSMAPEAVRRPF